MELKQRLESVRHRIARAAKSSGRLPEDIRLVAVSKTMTVETVSTAIDAGVDILGENYIQEARSKVNALADRDVDWHFIGRLQTNKAKYRPPGLVKFNRFCCRSMWPKRRPSQVPSPKTCTIWLPRWPDCRTSRWRV